MVKNSGWHSVGLGTQSGRHSVGTALGRTALSRTAHVEGQGLLFGGGYIFLPGIICGMRLHFLAR